MPFASRSLWFAGFLLVAPHHDAVADGYWYWCEPSKAYYPYVSSCPVPWRQVAPNSDPYGTREPQQSPSLPNPERDAAIADFKIVIKPMQRWAAIAMQASFCGIRSDEWSNTFGLALRARFDAKDAELDFTQQEIDDINKQLTDILQSLRDEGMTCISLVNSATMEELDQIQWRLTGGYH